MIEIIQNIIQFIFLWFIMCGVWHETMHLLECFRQGDTSSYMWIAFDPLPSMHYTWSNIVYDHNLRRLSGGLYSSITCFILVFIFPYIFTKWIFLTLGIVQLIYGIFEMLYINKISKKEYWILRYSIYIVTVCLMMLVYVLIV